MKTIITKAMGGGEEAMDFCVIRNTVYDFTDLVQMPKDEAENVDDVKVVAVIKVYCPAVMPITGEEYMGRVYEAVYEAMNKNGIELSL